jgi:2-keto-3-deoxy-L-rhamnonate aldolase RhmA
MVVVPTCAPDWISRCLAQAVIVPHIKTVEQAKMCENASKSPPLVIFTFSFKSETQLTDIMQGYCLVTMVTAMTQYATTLSYAAIPDVVNEEVMIMPTIETKEGVENVE